MLLAEQFNLGKLTKIAGNVFCAVSEQIPDSDIYLTNYSAFPRFSF